MPRQSGMLGKAQSPRKEQHVRGAAAAGEEHGLSEELEEGQQDEGRESKALVSRWAREAGGRAHPVDDVTLASCHFAS